MKVRTGGRKGASDIFPVDEENVRTHPPLIAACIAFAASVAAASVAFASDTEQAAEVAAPEIHAGEGSGATDTAPGTTASDPTPTPAAGDAAEPPVAALPPFVPEARGAPIARVGGGVRSAVAAPMLLVLAPARAGTTVLAAPALYWSIDAVPAEGQQLVFTLATGQGDPYERPLRRPTRTGLQRLDLARMGLALEVGTPYQWSVHLRVDPDDRARDVVARGRIERTERPSTLASEPGWRGYMEHAIWYDALDALTMKIEERPFDMRLRGIRQDVLDEAGLPEVPAAP